MPRNDYEHQAQSTLFEWIDWKAKQDERFLNICAIPNGGQRNAVVAAKLKAEGVRAGVPDILVAWPKLQAAYVYPKVKKSWGLEDGITIDVYEDWEGAHWVEGYCGLFIEMKIKPNTVKPEQKEWIARLTKAGYLCRVAWSFDEAQEILCEYFGVTP